MVSLIEKQEEFVLPFEDIKKEMIDIAGGKGANLGELVSFGVKVPPGFVISVKAFHYFLHYNKIAEKIQQILSNKDEKEASMIIKQLIINSEIPQEVISTIQSKFNELKQKIGSSGVLVAVRSSATAEDIGEASFAGQQDTYLNVRESELLDKVKLVWASLYNERAIAYRKMKNIDSSNIGIAVVVQKMVNAKSAGVMFTLHPATGDTKFIVIESNWGLGESVVGGKVTPDEVVIDKDSLKIVEKKTSEKLLKVIYNRNSGSNEEVPLIGEEAKEMSISNEEAIELAKMAKKIEEHYGHPMDIEWAIDSELQFPENVFIVQARPETFWTTNKRSGTQSTKASSAEIVVKGLAASPGLATGRARVILSVSDAKDFKKGDILITKMTDPDWVPVMRIAGAIVTDEGGITSHAAIVSRELGIPAVVGTRDATQKIKEGEEITVDATRGVVYRGRVEFEESIRIEESKQYVSEQVTYYPITGTKIYMNLGQPDVINKYISLPFDGIGLMRIEFIFSEWVKYHPLYLIKIGKPDIVVEKLAEGISLVASAIYPRPVVVRFSDFKTNEYRRLIGGEEFEIEERNPMIGWRGVSRYISTQYEKAFRLEVEAVKKVRDEMGLKNVWVMLPFVRTTWEVKRVLAIIEEMGLKRGVEFKVWIMAEVPSAIILADKFARLVDGFSIGSNDLAQLTLGVDRDSEILARMGYYDERDPAVLLSMKRLIRTAHKYGKTVSICGQAPSVYPEVAEFLVREGIDSISVNPDTVAYTRRLVESIERKIMLEKIRRV
ncbi:phosphoenolpyruvate synthase [Sulfolobales archaeon HS-7]|nr:phosphoenolpyruvate synthase [Sulfolobales archaeon HS-7]